MAKGRKLTISRSERYLGTYSYSEGHGTAVDTAELVEEDVWAMVEDMVDGGDDHSMNGSRGEWSPRSSTESNGTRRQLSHVGGLSLAFEDLGKSASARVLHQFRGQDSVSSRPRGRHMATSAPMNVPDWSKIYRVDSVESLHDSNDGFDDHESEVVPPHEYLAREHRKRTEHSVFEGVGRKLKGRDLSRVRDAVWSQTGFNG